MDLEFIDQRTRDLFIHRFYMFLQLYITSTDHDDAVDGVGTNSDSIELTDSNEDHSSSRDNYNESSSSFDNEYNFNAYIGAVDVPPIDYDDQTLLSSYNPLYRNSKRQVQVRGKRRDGMIYDHKDLNSNSSDSKERKQENPMLQMYHIYGRRQSEDEEEEEEYKLTEMK